MGKRYLSTLDVADIFQINQASIYKLHNHKDESRRLVPVNPTTYRGDGGYRYSAEDVERLKIFYEKQKTDITLPMAAKRLGVSTSTLYGLVKENEIEYEVKTIGERKAYIFDEEVIKAYKVAHPELGDQNVIYDRKHGYYLYQLWSNEAGHQGRIIEMKRIGGKAKILTTIMTEEGLIDAEEALKCGYKPVNTEVQNKVSSSYGYAVFEFPKPTTVDSIVYQVIELIFRFAGPYNLTLELNGKITMQVKKTDLKGINSNDHFDIIEKMKQFIVAGELVPKFDGVLIDSCYSPIILYVPNSIKGQILEAAGDDGSNVMDWLNTLLKNHFSN